MSHPLPSTPTTSQPPKLALTDHAGERLRQRGYRESDIELVVGCGTQLADTIVLTNRDVDREIKALRRQMTRLERLRGTAAIVREGAVVTVFRMTREQIRARRASRAHGDGSSACPRSSRRSSRPLVEHHAKQRPLRPGRERRAGLV